MAFVPFALAVHWKLTLLFVFPLPSALFQLPPGASVTTNELSSPMPTVVRSVLLPGLAQPLVTVIAGPAVGMVSILCGASAPGNGCGFFSGICSDSTVDASGFLPG